MDERLTKSDAGRPSITSQERVRREAEVNYGRGTVRLEGFVLSAAAEELNRRYINGELTSEELTNLVLAHCNS